MIFRELGRTGQLVSAMSLGGAAFGSMYGDLTVEDVRRTVHRAVDAGVNFVDTSPFYGRTLSESRLGEVLRSGLRDKILLGSKAGRNGPADFDFTPAAIRRSVEASLNRLQTDHLDILIAHDIEFAGDSELVFTETADTLHLLKREGKCRFIGMSAYPMEVLRQAIERCNLDVIITYSHHCLQNTRLLDELLPTAERHEVGLINASPLSMGLLTNQGPPDWHPASPAIRAACRTAADLCLKRGSDICRLAMQFCISEPRISSVISGAATVAEIDANLAAFDGSIDADLLKEVLEVLEPVTNCTWPSGQNPIVAPAKFRQ